MPILHPKTMTKNFFRAKIKFIFTAINYKHLNFRVEGRSELYVNSMQIKEIKKELNFSNSLIKV